MLLAGCVWGALFAAFASRPAVLLAEARGLYAAEDVGDRFQWSSNYATFPIYAGTGPTHVELELGASGWPGRQLPEVDLRTDTRHLARLPVNDQVRHYHLGLGSASALILQTEVDRPPENDSRWVGVKVLDLDGWTSGLPLRAASEAALFALLSIPVVVLARAVSRAGYGPIGAISAVALFLRLVAVRVAPPGFNQDEMVSAVDAWFLLHTARDHHGNLLPLGAQEAFGDWISPLLTYLEIPLVALFGPTPLAARLLTGLLGALVVPVIYALVRSLRLPMSAALCAALVVALSPWQTFFSRFAIPPSLVLLCWTLAILAALRFVQRGGRREAFTLAVVAGVGLYAYPTLKLAMPLLVGCAVALALGRHGRAHARRWFPAAVGLAVLWLPFGAVTLFNPASDTRLDQVWMDAPSTGAWIRQWWAGYTAYIHPTFLYLYGDGDRIHGVPGRGVQLIAEAPLFFLGLGVVVWRCVVGLRGRWRATREWFDWWLLAGVLLIAPLPVSLTQPSANSLRGVSIAPVYALVVAVGAAVVWGALTRLPRFRAPARAVLAATFGMVLLAQSLFWYREYVVHYPPTVAAAFQDGLPEAMRRLIVRAPAYAEVWIDTDGVAEPYIYLLGAAPLPPEEAQAVLEVQHRPGRFNAVTAVGRYKFRDLAEVPNDLPTLEAIPDSYGGPGFVIQRLDGTRPILLLRRMKL